MDRSTPRLRRGSWASRKLTRTPGRRQSWRRGAGATAQGAAEALAGLMASHSRLLWGHSVSEWLCPLGLIQVYTDGHSGITVNC